MIERCYWCGGIATSREHVPPKCLFPQDKDIKGVYNKTFRRDLITVPSCDEHNLAKSHDDEYLMVCLGSRVGNNGIAYVHTNTKIGRAVKRNPKLINVEDEGVICVGDKQFPVLYVHIDSQRLVYSLECISRALFFYEFNTRYTGPCKVISNIFALSKDTQSAKFQAKAAKALENEKNYWMNRKEGKNPEIFTYQFSQIDGMGALHYC